MRWMGLLFGKGRPVNRPPWPSSHYKGSALPVLINVGVTISQALKPRDTWEILRGWAGINRNWRKRPAGNLWMGKEKRKVSFQIPLNFYWLVVGRASSPPLILQHIKQRIFMSEKTKNNAVKRCSPGEVSALSKSDSWAVIIPAAITGLWMGQ